MPLLRETPLRARALVACAGGGARTPELALRVGDEILNVQPTFTPLYWTGTVGERTGLFTCSMVEFLGYDAPGAGAPMEQRILHALVRDLNALRAENETLRLQNTYFQSAAESIFPTTGATDNALFWAQVIETSSAFPVDGQQSQLIAAVHTVVPILEQRADGHWRTRIDNVAAWIQSRVVKVIPGTEGVICWAEALYDETGDGADELSIKEGDVIAITEKIAGGWWSGTLRGAKGLAPSNYLKEITPTASMITACLSPQAASSAAIPAPSSAATTPPQQSTPAIVAPLPTSTVGVSDAGDVQYWAHVMRAYTVPSEDLAFAPGAKIPIHGDGTKPGHLRTIKHGIAVDIPATSVARIPPGNHRIVCWAQAIFDYDAAQDGEHSFVNYQWVPVVERDTSGWWQVAIDGRLGVVPSNYLGEPGVEVLEQ